MRAKTKLKSASKPKTSTITQIFELYKLSVRNVRNCDTNERGTKHVATVAEHPLEYSLECALSY